MKYKLLLALVMLMPIASAFHTGYTDAPHQYGSGVYNAQRFGKETGYDPFYARSSFASNTEPSPVRSHINIRNKLDYKIYKNPSLLHPRKITNYHNRYMNLGKTNHPYQLGEKAGVKGVNYWS